MRKTILWLMLAVLLCSPALGERQYDIDAAVEALKECWRSEVYGSAENLEGYLEIKNTRVIEISDTPKADDSIMQQQADQFFGGVDYIVEFMLYSDLSCSAPYYQNAGAWECVVVYEDGTMQTPAHSPFYVYRSRTYSMDFSGIITDVIDLNQEYNAVYRLLQE